MNAVQMNVLLEELDGVVFVAVAGVVAAAAACLMDLEGFGTVATQHGGALWTSCGVLLIHGPRRGVSDRGGQGFPRRSSIVHGQPGKRNLPPQMRGLWPSSFLFLFLGTAHQCTAFDRLHVPFDFFTVVDGHVHLFSQISPPLVHFLFVLLIDLFLLGGRHFVAPPGPRPIVGLGGGVFLFGFFQGEDPTPIVYFVQVHRCCFQIVRCRRATKSQSSIILI